MAMFEQMSRFFERATHTLEDVAGALHEARAMLVALRPSVEALPQLICETQGLVSEARRALAEGRPIVLEVARHTREWLAEERSRPDRHPPAAE
jgi:hypothetical protein